MHAEFDISPLTPAEALEDTKFVAEWQQLIDAAADPHLLFASPDWFAHRTTTKDTIAAVWAVRDSGQRLVGVLPLAQRTFVLTFDVISRALLKIPLTVAEVLGSRLLIPIDQGLNNQLIARVLKFWPTCDGIYFDAVPRSSECSRMLHERAHTFGHAFLYSPFGFRPWHLLTLSSSFEDYLRSKSAKSRSTLRRKVRLLDKLGSVRISRFTQAAEVAEFLRGASAICGTTWQHRLLGLTISEDAATQQKFVDLANRRLMRCYVLWCNDNPSAYIVGYQYRGVFYYADVGYDEELAEFSPGTALLFEAIKDLHEFDPPTLINFGVGDASYKRRFGDQMDEDECLLILRQAWKNGLAIRAHQMFAASLEGVKRIIGRRVHK